MRAAEKAATDFNSVPDHSAFAVFAHRGHGLDRALKAVEGMPRTGGDHLKA